VRLYACQNEPANTRGSNAGPLGAGSCLLTVGLHPTRLSACGRPPRLTLPPLPHNVPKSTRIRQLRMSTAEKDLVADLVKAANDVRNAAKVRLALTVTLTALIVRYFRRR